MSKHTPELHYVCAPCPLGRLLLAGTEHGVSALSLGDDDALLLAWLHEQHPTHILLPQQKQLDSSLAAVLEYLEGKSLLKFVPVDLFGTMFQLRVWRQLQTLQPGQTCSYRELAVNIGQPQATRAVARACATNRVALIIPCHRVIRTDGKLGGYRWGLARKQSLLALEEGRVKSFG